MTDADSDEVLVIAARAGDREAWAALCQRHAPAVAAYLGARLRRPAVVDKLVGDTVVAAWRHLPELNDHREVLPWFRRMAAALAKRWRQEHPDEPIAEPFPPARCADDAALLTRLTALEAALGRLGEPERMALEGRFRGGLDDAALAQALRSDAAGADALVRRALAQLVRELAAG